MELRGEKSIREKITGIILTGLQFSWFEIVGVLWGAGKKIKQGFSAAWKTPYKAWKGGNQDVVPKEIKVKYSPRAAANTDGRMYRPA